MQRRPRLMPIEMADNRSTVCFKDHITGEVLNRHKIIQRISEGVYSQYHVHHLNLQRRTLQ